MLGRERYTLYFATSERVYHCQRCGRHFLWTLERRLGDASGVRIRYLDAEEARALAASFAREPLLDLRASWLRAHLECGCHVTK
jgi:hypothetical protein